MNNQFNNNGFNNDFNNGYNQQPMQQPMYQQQPMMQQPMNQGYGQPVYNQQPNKNSGGGIVGVIVVVIIIIGLVVFLLNYSGVIDLKGKSNNDNTEIKEASDKKDSSNASDTSKKDKDEKATTDYQSELKGLCSQVNSKGDYRKDEFLDRLEKHNQYMENKEYDKAAEMTAGFQYCDGGLCQVEDKEYNNYVYSCYEEKYYNLKPLTESNEYSLAQSTLVMSCTSNINFDDVKCENNVCTTTYNDSKNYSLDCNKYKSWFESIKNN